MESMKFIAVIGESEAKDILFSIQAGLPFEVCKKVFGFKIHQNIEELNDFKVSYVIVNEKKYATELCGGAEDRNTLVLRGETAAFVVAFSATDFESSISIGKKWIPAIKLYFPNIPIILLGYSITEEIPAVITDMANQIAREIKATKYFEISTSSEEESNIYEEAIRASLRNRNVLRSCKIAVVGSQDSGKTELIRRFVFGERLSVLDEYTNEPQYLYDTDDTIFATSIEIDGEEFDLRIQDVSVIKYNNQWKLSKTEKVAPLMEELKDSYMDKFRLAEDLLGRLKNTIARKIYFRMLPSGVAKQAENFRSNQVTYADIPPNYWLKDVDVIIFIFSFVHPESFYALTSELVLETLKYNKSDNFSIILLGNQIDLRNDPDTLKILSNQGKQPITDKKSKQLEREINAETNAVTYLNCSSNEQKEIENVFEEAVWASLRKMEKETQNNKPNMSRNKKPDLIKRVFKR